MRWVHEKVPKKGRIREWIVGIGDKAIPNDEGEGLSERECQSGQWRPLCEGLGIVSSSF